MVAGVAVLAFVNYLSFDLPQPGSTHPWVAYLELVAMTFAWPLALLVITSWTGSLGRALIWSLAGIGLVSMVAGGWNIAGHPFDTPLERVMSGLLVLAAVGVGGVVRNLLRHRRPAQQALPADNTPRSM